MVAPPQAGFCGMEWGSPVAYAPASETPAPAQLHRLAAATPGGARAHAGRLHARCCAGLTGARLLRQRRCHRSTLARTRRVGRGYRGEHGRAGGPARITRRERGARGSRPGAHGRLARRLRMPVRAKCWTAARLREQRAAARTAADSDRCADRSRHRSDRRPTAPCGAARPTADPIHDGLTHVGTARSATGVPAPQAPPDNACRAFVMGDTDEIFSLCGRRRRRCPPAVARPRLLELRLHAEL